MYYIIDSEIKHFAAKHRLDKQKSMFRGSSKCVMPTSHAHLSCPPHGVDAICSTMHDVAFVLFRYCDYDTRGSYLAIDIIMHNVLCPYGYIRHMRFGLSVVIQTHNFLYLCGY